MIGSLNRGVVITNINIGLSLKSCSHVAQKISYAERFFVSLIYAGTFLRSKFCLKKEKCARRTEFFTLCVYRALMFQQFGCFPTQLFIILARSNATQSCRSVALLRALLIQVYRLLANRVRFYVALPSGSYS